MWENIKFWLAKEFAEFMTAIAVLAVLFLIVGGIYLWCWIGDWRERRKGRPF